VNPLQSVEQLLPLRMPEASGLANWPIQLRLVPPNAPLLRGADLRLVADCVPFAMADFHRLLHRRPVVIGCPKLDDAGAYVEKLSAMLATSDVRSLTVVHMEVPCCTRLLSASPVIFALLATFATFPH
jgi:hypothetical protein